MLFNSRNNTIKVSRIVYEVIKKWGLIVCTEEYGEKKSKTELIFFQFTEIIVRQRNKLREIKNRDISVNNEIEIQKKKTMKLKNKYNDALET